LSDHSDSKTLFQLSLNSWNTITKRNIVDSLPQFVNGKLPRFKKSVRNIFFRSGKGFDFFSQQLNNKQE